MPTQDALPRRWIFGMPGVHFDREWHLGPVTVQPAGVAAADVAGCRPQTQVHESWAVGHELAAKLADRWQGYATVAVSAATLVQAEELIGYAMATLRFLLREIIQVNVDYHRIGLQGETDHSVREYLAFFPADRVAVGGKLVTSNVTFTFTAANLDQWDGDDRVGWIAGAMNAQLADRTSTEQRALTALTVLDRAFMATDAVTSTILYAVAVETLFSSSDDSDPRTKTTSWTIAARIAYLTCRSGCAKVRPACPYVMGFKGRAHLWDTAERWAGMGDEWRCSAFLDIARPPDMDRYFKRPSLFGARNEAAHQGRTSLGDDDLRWIRVYADGALAAFLAWIVNQPSASIEDLSHEIEEGARSLGQLTPRAR